MTQTIGVVFPDALMERVKEKFYDVDRDAEGRERLFFDNAGGSFRLKAATEQYIRIDSIPENSERGHTLAKFLARAQSLGAEDARLILNATGGRLHLSQTASGAMFEMVRAVAENTTGSNMVTSALEHPAAFDAVETYARRLCMEMRVAQSDPLTGGIDCADVLRLVDESTCLVSVMYASNLTGTRMDLPLLLKQIREKNPHAYILVDAVQYAPHAIVDLAHMAVDGICFAPYKFFGCRGSAVSWLSERMAGLPHDRLVEKDASSWELGSTNPAQFSVLTSIVDYVCWLGSWNQSVAGRRGAFCAGMTRIEQHERALLVRLLNGSGNVPGLRRIANVSVLLDHNDLSIRNLIVPIAFVGREHAEIVAAYEMRGVRVGERASSSLYSKRMLASLGLRGAIRISPLHCHSPADIDRFLRVTAEISATCG